ncbi:MAG: MBL fold metallo-hydrolase [Treponema sp.]|nr:MBL fold metallo-hydrolase [Treponema sp.]
MKIYFHLNLHGFSNCYIVANEFAKEALIIDPGKITKEMIQEIENDSYTLAAAFITHNHGNNVHGLKTLCKIYTPAIYAADWEVGGNNTRVITGDGIIKIAGLSVQHMALPGHTADSMVYKIGNVLFTGDAICAGKIGATNSGYADRMLRSNIEKKIFAENDATIIMPGYGPPSCVGAEKRFNIGMLLNEHVTV